MIYSEELAATIRTIKHQAGTIESLQAENARLTSEVARLREALGNAFCPRPVHGRPAFDTVKGCQQSDNCGCDLGEAFAKP